MLERQMASSEGLSFGRGCAGSGVAGGHAVELQAELWGVLAGAGRRSAMLATGVRERLRE